jgi:hypothetical protein
VKEPGRLDLAHIFLRTEAPPHAQRPRRGAHRTGASAPLGGVWEALGKRQKAIARAAVSFPLADKTTPAPETVLLVLALRHHKKEPRHVSLLPSLASPAAGHHGWSSRHRHGTQGVFVRYPGDERNRTVRQFASKAVRREARAAFELSGSARAQPRWGLSDCAGLASSS